MDIQGQLDPEWQAVNLLWKMRAWVGWGKDSEDIVNIVEGVIKYHRGDLDKSFRFAKHCLKLCWKARDKGSCADHLNGTTETFGQVCHALQRASDALINGRKFSGENPVAFGHGGAGSTPARLPD